MILHNVLTKKSIIKSAWLGENIYSLTDTTFSFPDQYQYDLLKVTKEYIARPDLISKMAYGSSEYADVLCKLNGISNPFELNENMVLVIPTPDCVMQFVKNVDADSNANVTSNLNVAKKKNESRKANEAITTDVRFKIDKTRNIVIY